MAAGTIPVQVGDVEVLVETVAVAGSENTSRLSDAAEDVTDAFSRAQQAILALATMTAQTIGEAGKRGAKPDHVAVEFGLKISARGGVVIAGASGEATLRVTLSYDAAPK